MTSRANGRSYGGLIREQDDCDPVSNQSLDGISHEGVLRRTIVERVMNHLER